MDQDIVIFDLDGCTADDEWRKEYIQKDNPDLVAMYKNYHDRCEQDSVLPAAKAIIDACRADGHKICFFTGRPIEYKDATMRWLKKQFDFTEAEGYLLCMREANDHRPSVEVKADMVGMVRNAFPTARILGAYDDREDIVQMYRSTFGMVAAELNATGLAPYMYGEYTRTVPIHEVVAASSEPLPTMPPPYAEAADDVRGEYNYEEPTTEWKPRTAVDVLQAAAGTYKVSNAVYKNNHEQVGEILRIMFPDGMTLLHPGDHEVYSLLVQIVGKLTRFGNNQLRHPDSIRDLIVYAAMLETIMSKHDIKFP
jgi:hypothetical protein